MIGNASTGIFLGSPETNTTITGNVLGTDASESAAHPISASGINVQGTNNTIGGVNAASENLISNSAQGAIRIAFDSNDGNQVLQNRGTVNSSRPFIDLTDPLGPGANVGTAANRGIQAPVISAGATAASVSGTSEANATIRVYRTFDAAAASPFNITSFVGETTANGSGNWTLGCPGPGCVQQIQGGERVAATQMDNLGNTSELSNAVSYSDLVPETTITKGPEGKTEDRTPKFKFQSDEGGSTFECKLKGGYKACDSPKKYGKLDFGKYTFQVRATDAAANTDATPGKRKFKVVKG